MNTQTQAGFTLLEMLIALALGALLMATISTTVMPLLTRTDASVETTSYLNTTTHAENLVDNITRIAAQSELIFPTAIDRGNTETALALKLKGTGFDMYNDMNGDQKAGIADTDDTPRGILVGSAEQDDDQDGVANEDPVDGIDNDGDGLIDEDAGNNHDSQAEPGVINFDDNGDGEYDAAAGVTISAAQQPWLPFVPNSYIPQVLVGDSRFSAVGNASYSSAQDDNEDGIANNGSMLTWSARLQSDKITCETPLITHDSAQQLATFRYYQYTCLDNVNTFEVVRSYNTHGQAVLEIVLEYSVPGQALKLSRQVVLP